LPVMVARTFNRSRVDRASRSSRVTVTTSPGANSSSKRRSCARSALAPLATSRHLARPVLPQRRHLSGDALNVGPDPRVPVNHWCILHLYPVSFSPLIWCRVWVDCRPSPTSWRTAQTSLMSKSVGAATSSSDWDKYGGADVDEAFSKA
jgi:hypothetical protein